MADKIEVVIYAYPAFPTCHKEVRKELKVIKKSFWSVFNNHAHQYVKKKGVSRPVLHIRLLKSNLPYTHQVLKLMLFRNSCLVSNTISFGVLFDQILPSSNNKLHTPLLCNEAVLPNLTSSGHRKKQSFGIILNFLTKTCSYASGSSVESFTSRARVS